MERFKTRLKLYWRKLNTGTVYRIEDPSQIDMLTLPDPTPDKPVIVNIVLFILTFLSTSYVGATEPGSFFEMIKSGLPYSCTLLTILLFHEFGHYFAARKFRVRATLPYFIPFPSIFGTMGAVIKTKSRIPDRRALLYIGAMGPIPGFVVSLAAVVYGISVSQVKPFVPSADGMTLVFGDSLLFSGIVYLFHGAIPRGYDIFISQYAFAGWIGFLVTALNLMPIGQLDGGHVLYALLGRKQTIAGWIVFSVILVLSAFWPGWTVWIVISLLLLMIGHPPVKKTSDLYLKDRIIGWSCILIFILTFIPVPVDII